MFGKYAIGLLFVFVASAWSLADPTLAQDETGSDFTFRRVKPPTSGTQKRITVSIDKTWPYDYAAPERKSSPAVLPDIAPHEPTGYDWFWSAVSPNLAAASPDRLDTALRALNGVADADKRTVAPDVANIEAIIAAYGAQILAATAGKRVSPALVLAVIAVESAGKPLAVSPKGAQGLMQLIPATAERFGVKDSSHSGYSAS